MSDPTSNDSPSGVTTGGVVGACLRSLAASFPVAASLAQAWSEYRGVQAERRIGEWFAEVRLELERIPNGLDKPPEFASEILERTVEKVVRETSALKLRAYAGFYSRFLRSEVEVDAGSAIGIIDALDSLTDADIQVLMQFRSRGPTRVDSVEYGFLQSSGATMRPNRQQLLGQVVQSISKLESRGMLGETTSQGTSGVYVGSGPLDAWYNRWPQKRFELLPFGEQFLRAIVGTST